VIQIEIENLKDMSYLVASGGAQWEFGYSKVLKGD
jgi:hypothetical protein